MPSRQDEQQARVEIARAWFNEDADYTLNPYCVVVSKGNGQAELLFESDDDASDYGEAVVEANRQLRRQIDSNPEEYVKLPLPSHKQIHEWFCEWLEATGDEGYFGSIGGWLKTYGDEDRRGAWSDFKYSKLDDYVTRIAAPYGLDVHLV
jgi:hypothetical protein